MYYRKFSKIFALFPDCVNLEKEMGRGIGQCILPSLAIAALKIQLINLNTQKHTQRLQCRGSQAFQPCTPVDINELRITGRNAVSWLRKFCKTKYFSSISLEIILPVNTFEDKRVMSCNAVIIYLHGKSCSWRPESWCGVDAWVPQMIYCKTAAVGKGKGCKN